MCVCVWGGGGNKTKKGKKTLPKNWRENLKKFFFLNCFLLKLFFCGGGWGGGGGNITIKGRQLLPINWRVILK